MTPEFLRSLQTTILASEPCAQYVHTNDMPKISSVEVAAKDKAIADIISAGRFRYQERLITTRGIRAVLSVTEAFAFIGLMKTLNAASEAPQWMADLFTAVGIPAPAHPAYFDAFQEAFGWLKAGGEGIDIGDATAHQMMDLLAAADPAQWGPIVAKLKAAAQVPDPVTAADVSRALRGPWGDE